MKKLNNKGFSAIEVILILVIISIVCGVGWYVWNAKKNTDTTYNATAKATTVTKPTAKTNAYSYSGWETYKSTSEGFSFRYPKSWNLVPVDITNNPQISEQIVLNATNDFHLDMDIVKTQGLGGAPTCSAANNISSVKGLNSKLYVNIYTEVGTTNNNKLTHYAIGLSKWADCNQPLKIGPYYPASKTTSQAVRFIGEFSKTNCGPVACEPTSMTLDEFKSKDQVKTAELILQSLSY
ncbi:MAG TPA: hypothetical protein VLF39_02365 [Candidatus Saccharimonadales bacterium]|nr:hypothetical protein [Candidatus Saccharimonadales bacterium]